METRRVTCVRDGSCDVGNHILSAKDPAENILKEVNKAGRDIGLSARIISIKWKCAPVVVASEIIDIGNICAKNYPGTTGQWPSKIRDHVNLIIPMKAPQVLTREIHNALVCDQILSIEASEPYAFDVWFLRCLVSY